MSIDETTFEIHDISEFPIVRSKGEVARFGYAPQWEMEAFVASVGFGQNEGWCGSTTSAPARRSWRTRH